MVSGTNENYSMYISEFYMSNTARAVDINWQKRTRLADSGGQLLNTLFIDTILQLVQKKLFCHFVRHNSPTKNDSNIK